MESGTKFTEVDLKEEEWTDYDEKVSCGDYEFIIKHLISLRYGSRLRYPSQLWKSKVNGKDYEGMFGSCRHKLSEMASWWAQLRSAMDSDLIDGHPYSKTP